MSQYSTLTMNLRCGEIFQKENQEFIIICIHCSKEFYSYSLFTSHLIQKLCSSNVKPLLQHTLKIEKDIIDDPLVKPKIEPTETIEQDEFLKKKKPKIEPIEIDNDVDDNNLQQKSMKLTPVMVKRTRIVKKKIIWDPDDPHTQLLCENYQTKLSPILNQNKKSKELIQQLQLSPSSRSTRKLTTNLPKSVENETRNLLVKTFQKQSRIVSSASRISDQTKSKKIKRIKKIIWDPDAIEDETSSYKTRLSSIKLPNAI